MSTVSNSDVNSKYVLVLREDQCQNLTVQEHPISSSEVLIAEIQAMVENPNKTVWDLYSKVERHFDSTIEFNLCFPYEYNNSYIDPAKCPDKISYYSRHDLIKKHRDEIINSFYYSRVKDHYKETYLNDLMARYETQLNKEELAKKQQFADTAIRYIQCSNLEKTLLQIKEDSSVKMFSSDYLGWTTFNYPITNDIQVMVKTNFGYGSAAYLVLAVKYKDMVLIPYSDLVHYYYANMKNLISYTRSYARRRESWKYALSYVADFVNQSKESPEQFIRQYILSEIDEMMKGLREILKNPGEILKHIKESKLEYISMNVIRPFMEEDETLFAMMPDESVSVFKAEKISGALMFMNSLEQIKELCPETEQVLREIKEMNLQIKPEIDVTIDSITESLKPHEKELSELNKKMAKLTRIMDYHYSKISNLIKNKSWNETKAIREEYEEKHPEYVRTRDEKNELYNVICDLEKLIRRRKNLRERMTVCLDRLKDNGLC